MYSADGEPFTKRVRDFIIDHRIRLSMGLVLGLILWNLVTGTIPGEVANPIEPLGAAGIALVLAGLGLRSWAAGTLRKGQMLTTWGAYRWCRHPLYLGTFLILAGFCFLVPSPVNFVVLLGPVWLQYPVTIRREEERLARKYGTAWASYTARTPRLIPLRLPRGLGGAWSLAQWSRSREYRAALTALLGMAALEVLHAGLLHLPGIR